MNALIILIVGMGIGLSFALIHKMIKEDIDHD